MVVITLYAYRPDQHEQAVYGLWQESLSAQWSLPREIFGRITLGSGVYQPGDHIVAVVGDKVVGFVATQTRHIPGAPVPVGALLLVLVAASYRRQSVGRRLMAQALTGMKERGVQEVQLGGGGRSYFWCGVPTTLPEAWAFFSACGWEERERSVDLIQHLGRYATPAWVTERLRPGHITIGTARPAEAQKVLAFEETHFPKWLHTYVHVVAREAWDDLVVAREGDDAIVGTSLVLAPGSSWWPGEVWDDCLGGATGAVGPLGVREDRREQGIGLGVAAFVTEALQQRGARTSYVGWTWLRDWYGRLGYRVWNEYVMTWQPL